MSLIISQTPANRLPAELVNNAAFVKQVDFDPVHQTTETGQPAEKIHGSALQRFDTIAISTENIATSVEAVSEEQANNRTTFTSFAEEFSKITQDYADIIRNYYAAEHEENLTYDSPSTHIWNKYKNPDSPDFRADLSEDERAWAYDQELDLLSGGKHLQMSNPYAFASAGVPPTLASAAMQANKACREQIDQSIQNLLIENGIELPADISFHLTADQDYTIHITGLEDEEQAAAIEQALNCGDNGKTCITISS